MESIILRETEFNKLKNQVSKNKDKKIIFTSEDDGLNRKVMEKLPISTILIPLIGRKDYMKQRNSGFNQVMAKIAKKNKISIAFSLDELINSKEKSKLLARITQSTMLCNKNKVKMTFIQEKYNRSRRELFSLAIVLGLHTSLFE